VGLQGLGAAARASAVAWPARPDRARFRPDTSASFYLWDATLSYRDHAGPVASVGRVRPWHTPGLVVLDGLQAGFATSGESEAGFYAGSLPDLVTSAPSHRYTTGLYGTTAASIFGATVRTSGRAGVVDGDHGPLLSCGADLLAETKRGARLLAEVLGSGPANDTRRARLDGLTVLVGVVPVDALTVDVSARETRGSHALTEPWRTAASGSTERVDISVDYAAASFLKVSGIAGAIEADGSTRHLLGGPELWLSDVLPARGRLGVGYLLEGGDWPMHSAYFTGQLTPAEPLILGLSGHVSLGYGDAAGWAETSAMIDVAMIPSPGWHLDVQLGSIFSRIMAPGTHPPLGLSASLGLTHTFD
jgi:hypothetical protein